MNYYATKQALAENKSLKDQLKSLEYDKKLLEEGIQYWKSKKEFWENNSKVWQDLYKLEKYGSPVAPPPVQEVPQLSTYAKVSPNEVNVSW